MKKSRTNDSIICSFNSRLMGKPYHSHRDGCYYPLGYILRVPIGRAVKLHFEKGPGNCSQRGLATAPERKAKQLPGPIWFLQRRLYDFFPQHHCPLGQTIPLLAIEFARFTVANKSS
jgi:hypothetical protein